MATDSYEIHHDLVGPNCKTDAPLLHFRGQNQVI